MRNKKIAATITTDAIDAAAKASAAAIKAYADAVKAGGK